MKYENVVSGKFISRPNRFIAHIEVEGKEEICHVMNTGRMKELLLPGAEVFLCKAKNPQRKTKFDLIGAEEMGLDAIGVTYGFATRDELCKYPNVAIIDDITELLEHV